MAKNKLYWEKEKKRKKERKERKKKEKRKKKKKKGLGQRTQNLHTVLIKTVTVGGR